MEKFIPR